MYFALVGCRWHIIERFVPQAPTDLIGQSYLEQTVDTKHRIPPT